MNRSLLLFGPLAALLLFAAWALLVDTSRDEARGREPSVRDLENTGDAGAKKPGANDASISRTTSGPTEQRGKQRPLGAKDVVLRLVDTHGKPVADLAVDLRLAAVVEEGSSEERLGAFGYRGAPESNFESLSEWMDEIDTSSSSDERGIVVFENWLPDENEASAGARVEVHWPRCVPPLETTTIEYRASGPVPFDVVVPDFAHLEVSSWTEDGEAIEAPLQIYVKELGTGEDPSTYFGGEETLLGLSRRYELHATIEQSLRLGPVEFESPATPGSSCEVDLRIGAQAPALRVRLLKPGGLPLAEEVVQSAFQVHEGDFQSPTTALRRQASRTILIHSDAAGWLRASPPPTPGTEHRFSWWLVVEGYEPVLFALPVLAEHGVIELGPYTLEPLSILLAGRVVDAKGRARRNLRIEIENHGHVTSGDEGHFEWVAPRAEDGELRTFRLQVVRFRGDHSAIVEAQEGSRDLLLKLLACGQVRGELYIPPHYSAASLKLQLRPRQVSFLDSVDVRHVTAHNGRFRFGRVVPGIYDIAVIDHALPEVPLFKVENLLVEPGEDCEDPRLQPLDLNRALSLLRFEFERPRGTSEENGTFTLSSVDGAGDSEHRGDAHTDKKLVLLMPYGKYDVRFDFPDFRIVERKGITEGSRIRLQAGIPLRIGVRGEFDPFMSSWTASIKSADEGLGFLEELSFDEEGAAVIRVPAPGSYDVEWDSWEASSFEGAAASSEESSFEQPTRWQVHKVADLDVRDSTVVQEFEIPAPEEKKRK